MRLAYCPPYHSKYNLVERTWGVLETHWNGALFDTAETVLRFAATMTYNRVRSAVKLCERAYEKGKSLTKQAMAAVESLVHRDAELPRYFVEIKRMSVSMGVILCTKRKSTRASAGLLVVS